MIKISLCTLGLVGILIQSACAYEFDAFEYVLGNYGGSVWGQVDFNASITDWDGDGDGDLLIGQRKLRYGTNGVVEYWENTGTVSAPYYTYRSLLVTGLVDG